MAPNNKRDNDETKGGVNRANWSKETLHVFCDLCIKFAERSKGKRGSTTSQRIPWKKALKGKETGLGWDHEKGTISASEEWWKNKIEENAHYKAFQDEGIDPDLDLKMDQLFGVSVAQGVHRFTPVQIEKEDVYIPSPPSVNFGDVPFQYDDEMSENEAFNNIQSRREWQEGSGMLLEKLDAMVKIVTERNMKDMELMNLESQKLDSSSSSLADSLAKLVSLPGLIPGSQEFCFACTLIEDPQKRIILDAFDLENKYGLLPSERMSTLEKLGIFLCVLSIVASNREAQERFQHSGETISRVFKEVLDATQGLSRDILRPRDPEFKEIPNQIANDTRYMPYFKDCIGAIDGTHMDVIVPEEDQLRYQGRKGTPTLNVLAACDFDLLFTYVLTSWEGSAHDSRIFLDTISNPSLNFPKPPPGKYYLADKGYLEREGYLTPYHKTRLSKIPDPTFVIIDKDPNSIPPEGLVDGDCHSMQEARHLSTSEMTKIRNEITASLMANRQSRRQRRIS
uniref:Transposase n=1 Tax=Chenopodium quinoa TaxID=63459 RepID=A0A803MZC3_CHEQI